MRMGPGLRKGMLSLHIIVSMGWLGALAAYLALDLIAATSADAHLVNAAWIGMNAIVTYVIVPLALATVVTGIIQGLGTKWGLVRYWWVLISLVLTIFAVVVLLSQTEHIRLTAESAARGGAVTGEHDGRGNTLLHSIGGMVVLIVITVLNVYKPPGLTVYGWRWQQGKRGTLQE